MTDDGIITNRMLLEHIQTHKRELDRRLDRLESRVERGFREARADRQNLHEDLEATMLQQFQHKKQLAVLTGAPAPEDYE